MPFHRQLTWKITVKLIFNKAQNILLMVLPSYLEIQLLKYVFCNPLIASIFKEVSNLHERAYSIQKQYHPYLEIQFLKYVFCNPFLACIFNEISNLHERAYNIQNNCFLVISLL